MGESVKSKYVTLSNKGVKRVVQYELDLRKKTLRRWFRALTGRKVEELPPKTLETQIEAILKLGASRNAKALPVLEKLKKYEVISTPEIPGHYVSVPRANHCDGTATQFEYYDEYVSGVEATYLLYHPRAREHLGAAYRICSEWHPSKEYEGIDYVVKVAIDTLKYDLEAQKVSLEQLKALEQKKNCSPKSDNNKPYRAGRGYAKNYDEDPYYIEAPHPSFR